MKAYLLLLVLFWRTAAAEEDVWIHKGFISGNTYLSFSAAQQRAYAMGIVDGITLAPFFGKGTVHDKWLENCVEKMTDSQVSAIFNKYLSEHPGRWHEGMNVLSYSAFLSACERR